MRRGRISMNNSKHTLPAAEEARLMKNQYQRNWYAKNPGKSQEYNRRYWEKRVMKDMMQDKEVTNNAG